MLVLGPPILLGPPGPEGPMGPPPPPMGIMLAFPPILPPGIPYTKWNVGIYKVPKSLNGKLYQVRWGSKSKKGEGNIIAVKKNLRWKKGSNIIFPLIFRLFWKNIKLGKG